MNKILCPKCFKALNVITDKEIDFDLRNIKLSKNVQKVWCNNCKRKIKFIVKEN